MTTAKQMSCVDKHAVVTGGGSGVGAACALALAEAGAHVTIVGRRSEQLDEIAGRHTSITGYACDVTDRDAFEAAVAIARAQSGPIAIMVASAGIAHSAPFHRLVPEDLTEMFSVNVMGVFNSFQIAHEDTRQQGWGRLIAIASIAGLKGYPYVSHYCASKHAVVGLVRALAQETATSGVTANAVCPSFLDTAMTERMLENITAQTGRSREEALSSLVARNPQGRLVSAEEVAGTVMWLCSNAAAAVNGQAIAIDGGES